MSIKINSSLYSSKPSFPVNEILNNKHLVYEIIQYISDLNIRLVNKTFLEVYSSEKENEELLKQLKNLNFSTSLEDIFYFPPNASAFIKIQIIKKTIEDFFKKRVFNLVEAYKEFYITNISNLMRKLPGGNEFFNSSEIRNLSPEEKYKAFIEWLPSQKNRLEIRCSNERLTFIPLELNYLTSLNSLYLDFNRIEVIPRGLKLPNLQLFCLENNPIKVIPETLELHPKATIWLSKKEEKHFKDFPGIRFK